MDQAARRRRRRGFSGCRGDRWSGAVGDKRRIKRWRHFRARLEPALDQDHTSSRQLGSVLQLLGTFWAFLHHHGPIIRVSEASGNHTADLALDDASTTDRYSFRTELAKSRRGNATRCSPNICRKQCRRCIDIYTISPSSAETSRLSVSAGYNRLEQNGPRTEVEMVTSD